MQFYKHTGALKVFLLTFYKTGAILKLRSAKNSHWDETKEPSPCVLVRITVLFIITHCIQTGEGLK